MTDIIIGAKLGRMDISNAARASGFSGSASRANVIRYAMLKAIGKSDQEARELAERKKIDSTPGMIVDSGQVTTKIDKDLLDEIESRFPDGITSRAMFVRYSLFIADNYTHEEALAEAKREPGRPRKQATP